jgi:hypothetical protein
VVTTPRSFWGSHFPSSCSRSPISQNCFSFSCIFFYQSPSFLRF